jgi:hypothetical protein
MKKDIIKIGSKALAFLTNGTNTDGVRDETSVRGSIVKQVFTAGGNYDIYPWGANNKMPHLKIQLLRSNGDAMNLLETRVDFLYGSGFGFFRHEVKAGKLIKTPFFSDEILELDKVVDLQILAVEMLTALCETANFVCHVSQDGSTPILTTRDVMTWRQAVAENGKVKAGIICPDWSDEDVVSKECIAVPYWDGRNGNDGLIHGKLPQSGQFYYGFPKWWAEESCEWLETMNVISGRIKETVGSNNNVSHIVQIASSYFDQMVADRQSSEELDEDFDFEAEKAKARKDFHQNAQDFLFNGKLKILVDECDVDVTGRLSPLINFQEVKRSLNSKEFIDAYDAALRAFANASGILSGLAGISDGKVMGGSGSELKVSANYQQFFRTPRERMLVSRVIDRVYRQHLNLPNDVYAGFYSVQLVNDNMDKGGVKTDNSDNANSKI